MARGFDIPSVDWIIQAAAPQDPNSFTHRIGRTARAGNILTKIGHTGNTLLYLYPSEESYIDFLRNKSIPIKTCNNFIKL